MHELAREAIRLDREAREHKHLSSQHRRLAQQARQRQSEIEEECARLGIKVTYGEGNNHGQQKRNRAHS